MAATSYVDIVARPDADTTASVLLSALFEQLHREFVACALTTVGVVFPEARTGVGLGDRLRLCGPEEDLRSLAAMSWLLRASDYYRVGALREVPTDHERRVVRRLQPNLSAAKIRRLLKRGSVTEERAAELLEGKGRLDAPFVQLRSSSSGQRFKLFFEQVSVGVGRAEDRFNAYGFGAAVPWF